MFDSMHAGSWSRVGLITREQSMMMKPVRQISTLPREVDLIEVALSKTLASMIMLTLDVRLNEAATQRLRDLHARHYLPSVQFTPLVPYSSRRLGSSQTTSEIEMRATILNSFRALRADIEGALTPWVSGYFTEIAGSSRPCLPATEAFVLRGVPTEEAAFRAWRASATRWLRSLGFEPEFNAFKGDWLMFWLPDRRDDDGMPPSRVAILAEQYRQAYPDVGGYQEEPLAIYHRSKEPEQRPAPRPERRPTSGR
jgi:hypothetical protein